MAIDAGDRAWITNGTSILYSEGSVVQLSDAGLILSGTNGYTGGGMYMPSAIAVDGTGDAWITDYTNSITELSNTGSPISNSTGYTGGGISTRCHSY